MSPKCKGYLSPDLLTQCTQHTVDHVRRYVNNRELLWVGGEIQPALGNKWDKCPEGFLTLTSAFKRASIGAA